MLDVAPPPRGRRPRRRPRPRGPGAQLTQEEGRLLAARGSCAARARPNRELSPTRTGGRRRSAASRTTSAGDKESGWSASSSGPDSLDLAALAAREDAIGQLVRALRDTRETRRRSATGRRRRPAEGEASPELREGPDGLRLDDPAWIAGPSRRGGFLLSRLLEREDRREVPGAPLQAYGRSATGGVLRAPPARAHVLFGRNEAGKSTALRALRGLLYGIERTTRDAHLHKAPDLRIGARLEGPGGIVLEVVRRKGNVRTLLDPAGNPLDETVLQRLLGGVGEDLFATMFGLDHETLRQGAEALLRGGGNVGESLFQAGIGGAGLHDVLASIEAEADGLFAPQAKTGRSHRPSRSSRNAKKRSVETRCRGAWRRRTAPSRGTRRAGHHQQKRGALQEEQKRLRRAKAALPLLAAVAELARRRAALSSVVLLPANAAREREESVRELTEATAALERLARTTRDLEARRARLEIPDALLAEETAVEDLQQDSGSARKAAAELQAFARKPIAGTARCARCAPSSAPARPGAERERSGSALSRWRPAPAPSASPPWGGRARGSRPHNGGAPDDRAALPPSASGSALAAAVRPAAGGGDLEAASTGSSGTRSRPEAARARSPHWLSARSRRSGSRSPVPCPTRRSRCTGRPGSRWTRSSPAASARARSGAGTSRGEDADRDAPRAGDYRP